MSVLRNGPCRVAYINSHVTIGSKMILRNANVTVSNLGHIIKPTSGCRNICCYQNGDAKNANMGCNATQQPSNRNCVDYGPGDMTCDISKGSLVVIALLVAKLV